RPYPTAYGQELNSDSALRLFADVRPRLRCRPFASEPAPDNSGPRHDLDAIPPPFAGQEGLVQSPGSTIELPQDDTKDQSNRVSVRLPSQTRGSLPEFFPAFPARSRACHVPEPFPEKI